MWKVNLPANDNALYELFRAFTFANGTAKHTLSEAEWDVIANIFERYDALLGTAHNDLKGLTLNDTTRRALFYAYEEIQENKRLSDLRARLLLACNLCPCCSISAADELDHHLPKSVFQPLSTYSRNLVPICHKCNNKKRAVTGENLDQSFIHVYFERLPEDLQFLKVDITITGNVLQTHFYSIQVEGITDAAYQQMQFQIQRVNLNERLDREINNLLFCSCLSLIDAYTTINDAANVSRLLIKTSVQFKAKFGLNDWRTVLIAALAENETFCGGGFIKILNYQI